MDIIPQIPGLIPYLWYVLVQQVRLAALDVRYRAHQSLPESQQVVDTVGRKLPGLEKESNV